MIVCGPLCVFFGCVVSALLDVCCVLLVVCYGLLFVGVVVSCLLFAG